jgi:hypothetical protein
MLWLWNQQSTCCGKVVLVGRSGSAREGVKYKSMIAAPLSFHGKQCCSATPEERVHLIICTAAGGVAHIASGGLDALDCPSAPLKHICGKDTTMR